MTENYPGNSKKERAEQQSQKEEARPEIKAVVKTPGVVRKASLGSRVRETFAGEGARETGTYVFFDVIIPAVKAMLFDTITQGADRILFGGRDVIRSGVANAPRHGRTDYNKVSTSNANRRYPGRDFEGNGGRELSNRARSNHQTGDILIDTRAEAEMVLDTMQDLISRFGWVSLPEFYSMAEVTAEFTDEKWGWSNISAAQIRPSKGKYVILLPSPEYDD